MAQESRDEKGAYFFGRAKGLGSLLGSIGRGLMKVLPVHLNSKETLHGTVSACLTDWAGGLAIASSSLEKTGVSTDIHTSYISTAKENDLLLIVGNATKVGLTMAYTTVSIQSLMTMVRKRQSRMAHI